MLYLLYHKGYETGQNLSNTLTELLGSSFSPLTSLAGLSRSDIKAGDVFIRWGSTRRDYKDEYFTSNGCRVMNTARSIIHNTNKRNSLSAFKQAGLNTPRVFDNKYDINCFPVLGRDNHHHGGKDIVIIKGSNILRRNKFDKIPTKDFYTKLINSKEEYRVHVFNGEVVRVTRKVFRGQNRDGEIAEREGIIRNDTYGWGHQNVALEYFDEDYANASIKAVEAVGLNFGAVDLLIERSTEEPYILEVNSCPRLNSIGLELYGDKIGALVSNQVQRKKSKYFWD